MSDTPRYKMIVDVLAVSIALFGVPAYFYDQHLDLREARNARALDYVETFNSGEILASRLALFEVWTQMPAHAAILQSAPSAANLARTVGQMAARDPTFARDIVKVANLLDTAFYCVEAGNCAADPLHDSVILPAKAFDALYGPYLAQLRDAGLSTSTGLGLSRLADLAAP